MLTRKEFLYNGTRLALFAYFSEHFTSMAGASFDEQLPLDNAFNPVQDYIRRYMLPDGDLHSDQAQRLSFDIITWGHGDRVKRRCNDQAGTLILERMPSGKIVSYRFQQTIDGHKWAGSFVTQNTSWAPLKEWKLFFSSTHPVSGLRDLCATHETGYVDSTEHRAFVETVNYVYSHSLNHPASTQWALLDQGQAMLDAQEPQQLDLLYELSQLRPRQTIQRSAAATTSILRNHLTCFLHTGEGTLPTHYIVDQQGRVLFATVLMTSFVLRSIENL